MLLSPPPPPPAQNTRTADPTLLASALHLFHVAVTVAFPHLVSRVPLLIQEVFVRLIQVCSHARAGRIPRPVCLAATTHPQAQPRLVRLDFIALPPCSPGHPLSSRPF